MVPKNLCIALICATLAWGTAAVADEYRAGEFLSLDLSKAVLSPKPLGPAASFTPVPVQARADRPSPASQARVEPKAEPRIAASRPATAQARAEKPRGAARTKLARRHGNPLDAQALDTRVQVWPCKSGGICSWRRQSRADQGGE